MNKKTLVILLLSQFLLLGCASNNYTDAPSTMAGMYSKYACIGYSGELKPIEEVGVVTTDGIILIKTIDGQPVSRFKMYKSSGFYSGGRYQLHLLPGVHVLTMGAYYDKGGGYRYWSEADATKLINITKGQVIHLTVFKKDKTWMPQESDGSSAFETIASDFKDLTSKK